MEMVHRAMALANVETIGRGDRAGDISFGFCHSGCRVMMTR